MPDCTMLDQAFQLGARVVDLDTGELISAGGLATVGALREEGGPSHGASGTGVNQGGLSHPHNCTQPKGTVSIWMGGSLIQACKPAGEPHEQKGGGKRGKVKEFSPASRRRMQYLVAKIQRVKLPVMVTLTYPAEFPTAGYVWKNDLRKWWQRLHRKLPGAGLIWKLEPQQRGAPHFHLLIWGVDGVPLHEFKAWVSKSWYQVVGSGDEKHLKAGTRVELIRSQRGVMGYATKYIGKMVSSSDVEGWVEPGRFWGVKGGESIPWAQLVRTAVTFRGSVKVLRALRACLKASMRSKGRHCRPLGNLPSLMLISCDPERWARILSDLTSD